MGGARVDRGEQYLPIWYSERFAEAGMEPSVGSVDGSYDDALAEPVMRLFKAEVIRRKGGGASPPGCRVHDPRVDVLV